jgi:PAS domain S-box-containing protein
MKVVSWLAGRDGTPGMEQDLLWGWGTLILSLAVVAGYSVIAFNWCLQRRVAHSAEARKAFWRMLFTSAWCAALGAAFFVAEMPWRVWRIYDLVLLFIAGRTWWFAFRMRGLSLVDERMAEIGELAESAARYREMAEYLPHIVWTAGGDGRIDFSNRRWAEYAGDGRSWVDAVHPDEQSAVYTWWAKAVATREPVSREIRMVGADGAARAFILTATPLVKGDAVHWLGACADIEDQKVLAAEREAQARQKSFLLNALGHDLRAPLNTIVLNAHLVKISAPDERLVECAATIGESAVAAGELVTRLLDYAKAGAQDSNELAPVPVAGLLHQIERRFAHVTARKGIHLRVDRSLDVEVLTDRVKLERIVSNLVDNAIKFTSSGGITVEPSISSAADDERRLTIRVSDTGIGVPEKNVPYLFDEFYQVDNHERDRSKGFGMGLAICRTLARQLGGDVRLADTGPGGSCFEVVVPHRAVGDDDAGAGGRGRPGGAAGAVVDPADPRLCRV